MLRGPKLAIKRLLMEVQGVSEEVLLLSRSTKAVGQCNGEALGAKSVPRATTTAPPDKQTAPNLINTERLHTLTQRASASLIKLQFCITLLRRGVAQLKPQLHALICSATPLYSLVCIPLAISKDAHNTRTPPSFTGLVRH